MAKLSVYNTIDRSQLGGKFVPLIQSGVSNYKILASDLGKEYHPGDAIEITDTGEINVKFSPGEFEIVNSYLSINPDDSRGVFNGSNGLYIASADDTINVSSYGISVNKSALSIPTADSLAGRGLVSKGGMLYVKSANGTINVSPDGIGVIRSSLSIPDAYSLAGSGLEAVDSDLIYVKSANGTINVSSLGIKVDTSVLAGRYLRSDSNHGITVDTAPLAHAITGSGLVETNGLIGVNVNTATGIIVNDNKLYLNAGYGLHTTNNTVKVKAANNSIGVSSAGIKVDTYYLAGHGLSSYYGTLLCVHSADKFIKVAPTGVGLHYQNLISSLANSSGGSSNIKIAYNYLYTATGDGLRWGSNNAIYVKSANSTIDVSSSGISVNPGYSLSSTSVGLEVNPSNDTLIVNSGGVSVNTSYLAGYGLSSVSNSLEVKPADNTITVGPDGVGVNKSALSIPTASSLVGSGLTSRGSYLYVQSADGSIGVSTDGVYVKAGAGLETTPVGLSVKSSDGSIFVDGSGIGVDLRKAKYVGSGLTNSDGELAVKAADDSIGVSPEGVKVNAGYGLETTHNGLCVKSYDNTIDVSEDGIGVNTLALSIPTAHSLAGMGLNYSGDVLYVQTADNTIDVSSTGIKVNPSAITGSGLVTTNGAIGVNVNTATGIIVKDNKLYLNAGLGFHTTNKTLNLKFDDTSILGAGDSGIYLQYGYGFSADSNFCGLTLKGLRSNHTNLDLTAFSASNGYIYANTYKMAGSGLVASKNSNEFRAHTLLNVKSADDTINVSSSGISVNKSALSIPTASSLAGHGLIANPEGKLDIYYGPGLAIDTTSSMVYVDYGSGLGVDSSGKLYATSSSTPDIGKGLWLASDNNDLLSVYAGSGLMFDTQNRVSVYAGSGLTLVGPEGEGPLQVKAGSKNTISVLDDGIEVNAGPGLCYAGSLYIQSADNSINVATDGITVNYGDGLFMNSASKLAVNAGSGLQVSEIEKKLTVYAGSGLGFDTYGDSLEVKSADNTINVSSEGIKVAEGFGLPDYSSAVTATQNTEYTADANCWLYMQVYSWSNSSGGSVNKSIVIDGVTVAYLSSFWYSVPSIMVPCKKGSVYQFKNSQTGEGSYTFKVYKCLK